MKQSEQYRRTVDRRLAALRRSGRPVVVFGAGRAGWHIMKVLRHHDIQIHAFAANDAATRPAYHGYPVATPEALAGENRDAETLLGVFVPATARAIHAQLQRLGFSSVSHEAAAFLFAYFERVARRDCDYDALADSIRVLFEHYEENPQSYGRTGTGAFISPFVTSVVTQKCTLRCRDCAQLMPYYDSPVNYPVDSVIRDLRRYAAACTIVPEISIHGGEPFLHPRIAEICRQAASIPNVVFVNLTTNSTLLPSSATLRELAACGADVHQSGGYGALSTHFDALAQSLDDHGVYSDVLFCSSTQQWTRPVPVVKYERPAARNDEMYVKCTSTNVCCQLIDGELHRCALSAHAMHQGVIPKDERDYVDLRRAGQGDEALGQEIRAFLSRRTALGVCSYCDPDAGMLVPPAIQLPRRARDLPRALEATGE